MNILKGLDRIFFVLAIISVPVTFITSIDFVSNQLITIKSNPEYMRWRDEYDLRDKLIIKKHEATKTRILLKAYADQIKPLTPYQVRNKMTDGTLAVEDLIKAGSTYATSTGIDEFSPYKDPKRDIQIKSSYHSIKAVVYSLGLAMLSFFIVLHGLKKLLRASIWFSKWVVAGFSDDKG